MISLVTPTRPTFRAAPALSNTILVNNGAGRNALGAEDRDSPTAEQQRDAFRGLVATLIRIRANVVSTAMLGATVERELEPSVFEPVEPAHPWVKLLRYPNNNGFSRLYLWKWAQQAKDMGRGAFFLILRKGGMPTLLHPVFREFGEMRPVGNAAGGIERYVYIRSDGDRQYFDARDVIWLRHPHPVNPLEAASLLEIAAYEADTDLYAHIYRRDILRNGGFPRLQATTDQQLTVPQVEEMNNVLEAKIFGPGTQDGWNIGAEARSGHSRIPVLSNGTELKPIGLSPQDMEYVEAANLTTADLMTIFGFPQGYFTDKANRANAEQAERTFIARTAQPEAAENADQLTTALITAFGADPQSGLAVIPADIVPSDPDYDLKRDEMHLRTGARTLNELRERDGEEAYPDGDEPLVSAALVPLRDAVKEPEPMPVMTPGTPPSAPSSEAPSPDGTDDPDEPSGDERSILKGDPLRTAFLHQLGKVRALRMNTDDTLDLEWRAVDAEKMRAEVVVEQAARRFYEAMTVRVAAALDTHRSYAPETRALVDEVFDLAALLSLLEDELGPSIARTVRRGFETGALRIGVDLDFDATRPGVRRALAEQMEKARSIPQTAKDAVGRAIEEGLAAGEETAQIAARVRSLLSGMTDWKAREIAQTAGTAGFEAGQVESFRAGDVARKRWLTQRDGIVRPAHDALDGQEVGVDEAFSNGLEYPQEPNCRCTLLPILGPDDDAEPRSWREKRNARILADYPALKDEHGHAEAKAMLAQREGLSETTVRDIIYKG